MTIAKRRNSAAPSTSVVLLLVACTGCSVDQYLEEQPHLGRAEERRLTRIEPVSMADLSKSAVSMDAEPEAAGGTIDALLRPMEGEEKLVCSLEDVRVSVLKHNLGLAVDRLSPAIAQQTVLEEKGKFDAVLSLQGGRYIDVSSAASFGAPDAIYDEEYNFVDVGLKVPLMTGGSLNVSTEAYEYRTFLEDPQNPTSPQNPVTAFPSQISVNLQQSLLKGAGVDVALGPIVIAATQQRQELAALRLNVINTLISAETAYWQLYQALANMKIARGLYKAAQDQVVDAQAAVKAGVGSDVSVFRAKLSVAEEAQGMISANTRVKTTERNLKVLMNRPDLRLDSKQVIDTDVEPVRIGFKFELGELTRLAIRHRAEILESEFAIAAAGIGVDLARNGLLPELELMTGVSFLGIDSQNSFSAFGQMAQGQAPVGWSLAGEFSMPIGNEEAEAQYRKALLDRMQAIATKRQRELTIAQDVYDAVDEIDRAWLTMQAARDAENEATRNFDAARELFKQGLQTGLAVALALQDLGQAKRSYLAATVDYQLQLVKLAAATGTFLGRNNVELGAFEVTSDQSLEREAADLRASEESPLIPGAAAGTGGS